MTVASTFDCYDSDEERLNHGVVDWLELDWDCDVGVCSSKDEVGVCCEDVGVC